MRLGYLLGYSGSALDLDIDRVREAEALGYESVWTAEAWGSDACTPLAWIAAQTERIKLGTAVMQLPGRSPANAAMTAMTLDALSGGRFIMGLGTSGPQVVEGWHGQPFHKPLTWLREYIQIVKQVFARERPLEFQGEIYQIPYRGEGSSGQGKPLKSILHGRKDIPIYTGSMAPKSQQMSGELAEGCLVTCYNPDRPEIVEENLRAGLARSGRRREDFTLASSVIVSVGDDLDALRMPLKLQLALYVGGMGSRSTNFYNAYLQKAGFEEAARKVQDLYLAGHKSEAIAAIPDAMVDALYLVGPKERIRDRLAAWRASGVDLLMVGAYDQAAVRLVAELMAE